MGYFAGLDIGTTSTKVFMYDGDGGIRGSGKAGYPLLVPEPGRAEQTPEAILNAVTQAFRLAMADSGLKPADIEAVGVSTAMHSLMAVDQDGKPMTPMLTWGDNRSAPQVAELKRRGLAQELYALTGTPVHPMSPLSKLLWWRENMPDLYRRAAKFISIKEYVLYQFFGIYVVDVSVASATGLLRLSGDDWCSEALELAGIDRSRLSEVVPITRVLQGMKPEMAELCGLAADTPWVVGASDGALANIGSGAAGLARTSVTIGTSGAVRRFASEPLIDPDGRTFCYAFSADRWLVGGPTNNGGIALRWFRENLLGERHSPGREEPRAGKGHMAPARRQNRDRARTGYGSAISSTGGQGQGGTFDNLIQWAMSVPPGAEGLLFLPYLSGERAPYWNADARGMFVGAGLHHEQKHFARAVLEGVLFAVNSVTESLGTLAGPTGSLLASGGFAASPAWTGLLADIAGIPVEVPDTYEASAFGAAALAMLGTGALASLDQLDANVRLLRRHEPNPGSHEIYKKMFDIFKDIYKRMEPVFPGLVSMQGRPGNS